MTTDAGALAGTDAGHPAYGVGSFASVGVALLLTLFLLTPRRTAKRAPAASPG